MKTVTKTEHVAASVFAKPPIEAFTGDYSMPEDKMVDGPRFESPRIQMDM